MDGTGIGLAGRGEAGSLLVVVDERAQILLAEGDALAHLGLDRQAVPGRSALAAFASVAPLARALADALVGRQSRVELPVDGASCELVCEPRRAAGGRVTGALIVGRPGDRHGEGNGDGRLRARHALDLFLLQIPGLVWATDRALRVTRALGHGATGGGLALEPGRTLYELLGSDDPTEPAIAAHLGALAGRPQRLRFRVGGRWYEAIVEPCRDDDQVTGTAGVAVDVTERIGAEEALGRSLSLLSATLEATADGILVVEASGRVAAHNRNFLTMWRIPPELSTRGDDAAMLSYVAEQLESPEQFLASVDELYRQPERERLDVLRFRDGRVFERYSRPQRIDGDIVGRVWSFRDVTTRERLLARVTFLADASRLLAALDVEKALDAVARLAVPTLGDACAIDLYGDGGPRRLVAATRDPARPLRLATVAVTHPTLFDDDDGASRMTVPLGRAGSRLGALTFAAAPGVRYTSDDLGFVEGLARRISLSLENARLLRDTREALKARDEFLAIAGHELRGPLGAVHLAVQGLRSGIVRPDGATQLLDTIEREDRRLNRFVDELLDVGRIRGGRLEFMLEEVDLGAAVRDVVARLDVEIARAGTPIELAIADGVVGRWDRFRVEQVVTNLLTNALKFARRRPIAIRVRRDGATAILTVRDHGIGIPPETRERIFRAFERAVSSRHYGGLGLGLFIVKTVVEAQGGRVRVDDTEGGGATFTVELPTGKAA